MITRVIVFLLINFAGLALGGIFTGEGVPSEWYQNLNKAPWTPPGWVFGSAWTTIMICFAVYMAALWDKESNKKRLITLFALSWILNFVWNPVFFYFHHIVLGLIIITSLTVLIAYILFNYNNVQKWYSGLLLPYFLWLLIATSLNAFILMNN